MVTLTKLYKVARATVEVTGIEIYNSETYEPIYLQPNYVQQRDLKQDEILRVDVHVKNRGTLTANVTAKIILFDSEITTNQLEMLIPSNETTFSFDVPYDGSLFFNFDVVAFGSFGEDYEQISQSSEPFTIQLKGGKEQKVENNEKVFSVGLFDYDIFIILIIVIVIVLLVVLMVMSKKRREKMAECSECGGLIPLDATECPKCGAEFSDEIECGECGTLMKITDTTCPSCGAVFAKEGESEGKAGAEGEEAIPTPPMTPFGGAAAKPPAPAAAPKPPTQAPAKPKPGPSPKPAAGKPTPSPAAAAPTAAKPARPVPPEPPAMPPKPAKAAVEEETEEKAECYRCGAIVPLSASMCPECGAEFE